MGKLKDEDVTKLKEFLCVCISEMRVDDAVIFLRLLKRKSASLTAHQYKILLTACDDYVVKLNGRNLDFQGLGLLPT